MPSKNKVNFSKRILELRNNLRMSQRELAKEFGVSPAAVAHWETGERQISGPVKKLLEIFEKNSNAIRDLHE